MKDTLEIERRFILRDNISNFENFENFFNLRWNNFAPKLTLHLFKKYD